MCTDYTIDIREPESSKNSGLQTLELLAFVPVSVKKQQR